MPGVAVFTAAPGEKVATKVVHTLAREVMDLDEETSQTIASIVAGFASIPTPG